MGADIPDGIPYLIVNVPYPVVGIKTNKYEISQKAYQYGFSSEWDGPYYRLEKMTGPKDLVFNMTKLLNIELKDMPEIYKKSDFTTMFDLTNRNIGKAPNVVDEVIYWYISHDLIPPQSDADLIKAMSLSLMKYVIDTVYQLAELVDMDFNQLYVIGVSEENKTLNIAYEELEKKIKHHIVKEDTTAIGNFRLQEWILNHKH